MKLKKKKTQLKNRIRSKSKKIKKIKFEKDELNKQKKILKTKKKEISPKVVKTKKKKNNFKKDDNIVKLGSSLNKPKKKIVDICIILEKCSIEEISNYLINKGKTENFPDITARE